jgi:hypothetical protein
MDDWTDDMHYSGTLVVTRAKPNIGRINSGAIEHSSLKVRNTSNSM